MAKKPAPAAKKTKKPSAADNAKKSKTSAAPDSGNGPLIKQVLAATNGILRLAPTWVPRSFLMPGRRLKLHPSDLYALGARRGGIEWALNQVWSAKLEYQHIDLGRSTGLSAPVIPPNGVIIFVSPLNNKFDTVRVGLNYRFATR